MLRSEANAIEIADLPDIGIESLSESLGGVAYENIPTVCIPMHCFELSNHVALTIRNSTS